MEEHSLIKGLKDGDNEDFRYIYEKYKEKLNSYVYYKIKNKSEAEDLVQEIFTKVYKNIGLYDETQSTFYNFLLSNANQIIAEYSRKNISEAIQTKIQQRQSANLEILKILNIIVERFPQLRFTQILTNLELDKDLFYEESVDTLNNIKKQLEGKFSL